LIWRLKSYTGTSFCNNPHTSLTKIRKQEQDPGEQRIAKRRSLLWAVAFTVDSGAWLTNNNLDRKPNRKSSWMRAALDRTTAEMVDKENPPRENWRQQWRKSSGNARAHAGEYENQQNTVAHLNEMETLRQKWILLANAQQKIPELQIVFFLIPWERTTTQR
jgi:hypothetical protein